MNRSERRARFGGDRRLGMRPEELLASLAPAPPGGLGVGDGLSPYRRIQVRDPAPPVGEVEPISDRWLALGRGGSAAGHARRRVVPRMTTIRPMPIRTMGHRSRQAMLGMS